MPAASGVGAALAAYAAERGLAATSVGRGDLAMKLANMAEF